MEDLKNIELKGSMSASSDSPKTFTGIAYTGGLIDVGFSLPVVVDLSGMDIPASIPLLCDHNNAVESKLGDLTAKVDGHDLVISGEITSKSYKALNLVEMAKAGSAWQLSIGATIDEVEEAEGAEINGMPVEGKCYHVKKSKLREVSVTPCGADSNTSLQIQAQASIEVKTTPNEGGTMENNRQTNETDILAAERERVKAVTEVCAGEHADILSSAITEGWTREQTAEKVLAAVRSSRPQVAVSAPVQNNDAAIEASLAMAAGLGEDKVAGIYGEDAVKASAPFRGMGLKDLVRVYAALNGYKCNTVDGRAIHAALTTTSTLPSILGNVMTKKIYDAYASYDPIAPKVCDIIDLPDYKAVGSYSLLDGDSNGLSEVTETGDHAAELTEIQLSETGNTTQAKLYGNIITLTEQAIYNDDAGAFFRIAGVLGRRAAMSLDAAFFSKASTSSTGIYTANTNLFTGDSSTTYAFAFNTLIDMYNNFVSASEFKPAILLVPAQDELLARQIIASSEWRDTTSNKTYAVRNPLANMLTVYGSKKLVKDWLLLADPKEIPAFQLGFVRGQSRPVVEDAPVPFNKLGHAWRVTYRYGVGAIDAQGALLVKAYNANASSSSSSSSSSVG